MDKRLKIRYDFNFPFALDRGGGRYVIENLVKYLSKNHEVKILDKSAESVDFDVLLLFTFTALEAGVVEFYKENGVKVLLFPIFDRLVPYWKMDILSKMYFPVYHEYIMRKRMCAVADLVITHNQTEKNDMAKYYCKDADKLRVFYLAINEDVVEKGDSISDEFVVKNIGFKDYVFCPAAQINKRKNQLSLVKALKGTGIKLVLNNTQAIQDNLEAEFRRLTDGDKDIICLEKLSRDELISCYKSAKVSVSVSQAETAGLVNLEGAYLGCNLVVSDLPALREYLQDFPVAYINQNDPESIRNAIKKAMEVEYNPRIRQFILENYTWNKYTASIEQEIVKLTA